MLPIDIEEAGLGEHLQHEVAQSPVTIDDAHLAAQRIPLVSPAGAVEDSHPLHRIEESDMAVALQRVEPAEHLSAARLDTRRSARRRYQAVIQRTRCGLRILRNLPATIDAHRFEHPRRERRGHDLRQRL